MINDIRHRDYKAAYKPSVEAAAEVIEPYEKPPEEPDVIARAAIANSTRTNVSLLGHDFVDLHLKRIL